MGWLSIILTLISDLPQIIGIIKEIVSLIHTLPKGQRSGAISELKTAYETARTTGDNGPLKRLHDRLCADGLGVGCSMDLKG